MHKRLLPVAMRILIVTETLVAGGAETFVVRLANGLADTHEVTIAVMHGELTNAALHAQVGAAVRVEQLTYPAKRLLSKVDGLARTIGADASAMRAIQRRWLERLIRRIEPDIVHSHLFKADRLVVETRGTRPAMRHIVTLHGDYAPFLTGAANPQMPGLAAWMERIMRSADKIVAICAEHHAFVREHFPAKLGKTVTIHNGFAPWRPPVAQDGGPKRRLTFVMASRGVKLKGWAKAIAAFARLDPGSAELILVGQGAYLDQLSAGPVPPDVRFVGFSDNPVDWIAGADIGLLPSEFPHESLPTAVMEYLYCGKPVIATDVGEIATMIGGAGVLLPFEDQRISVEDLTAAMQAYVDDPALRARHAALAPAAFAKFDMGRCAAAYVALYAEVATSSSTKASH